MEKNFRDTVQIIGTGSALPDDILQNSELGELLGVTNEWIIERTGILERRKARIDESTSKFATHACKKALQAAEIPASDIDLLICTTITPDMQMPATACIVQAALGVHNAVCFDIAAACSGFLYGLEVGEKMIRSGIYNKALVVSADLMTRCIDYQDHKTSPLFGDGAGAVILAKSPNTKGIQALKIYSNGNLANLVTIASLNSYSDHSYFLENKQQYLKMNGSALFREAIKAMVGVTTEILKREEILIGEIDLFIPHQGNERILQAYARELGVGNEKVYSNIAHVGNTASASIPIAIDECIRNGEITEGSKVIICSFGGGATWGAALIQF